MILTAVEIALRQCILQYCQHHLLKQQKDAITEQKQNGNRL